jgi:multidrug efflux pump
VQFRIVGPDPEELRRIAADVRAVMRANPHIRNVSDNWGNPSKMVDVDVDQDKARLLGLSSEDIATTLQTLQQGATITQYREGTDMIPVLARAEARERQDLAGLRMPISPHRTGMRCRLGRLHAFVTGWSSRHCGGGTARRY